jgi:cobalt-precorrin 5A hydrolase / precorrin-3B C17-methyltransferase
VLAILRQSRPSDTPVAVVQDAQRPGQHIRLDTLDGLDPQAVETHSILIVGSSRTRVVAGRMVTPADS